MKKVFIDEKKWHDEVVMFLRSKNIAWENETFFQFDMRTAIVMFIAGVFIGGLVAAFVI